MSDKFCHGEHLDCTVSIANNIFGVSVLLVHAWTLATLSKNDDGFENVVKIFPVIEIILRLLQVDRHGKCMSIFQK